jgi:tetratricopeptide (TPR) repeat protein
MDILKLITSLLLTILPVAILIRDWKFHDKRTKKHHNITRGIIIFWCIGSITATYFVWTDSAQIKELVDGKNTLIQQNTELTGKIENYQKDLNEKDRKIKELEEKAKKAERGITLTYDFNGAQRKTTRPGHISLSHGPEIEIFKKMQEFETQKKYTELVTLCEEQIEKTPEWLTPYFYIGIAFANLGDRDKAIEMFEYVKENSFGDSAYSQANDFLERLKNQ